MNIVKDQGNENVERKIKKRPGTYWISLTILSYTINKLIVLHICGRVFNTFCSLSTLIYILQQCLPRVFFVGWVASSFAYCK